MFLKTCKCGKSQKNFKIDIGEFFINDCCLLEGYDHLGKKEGEIEEVKEEILNVDSFEKEEKELSITEIRKLLDEQGIEYHKNSSRRQLLKLLK